MCAFVRSLVAVLTVFVATAVPLSAQQPTYPGGTYEPSVNRTAYPRRGYPASSETVHTDERPSIGVSLLMAYPQGDFGGDTSNRHDYYYWNDRNVPGFGTGFGIKASLAVPLGRIGIEPNVGYVRFKGDKGDYGYGYDNGYQPTQMTYEIKSFGVNLLWYFSKHRSDYASYLFLGGTLDNETLNIGGKPYSSQFPDRYDVKRNGAVFGYGGIMNGRDAALEFRLGLHVTVSGSMPNDLNLPNANYWFLEVGARF